MSIVSGLIELAADNVTGFVEFDGDFVSGLPGFTGRRVGLAMAFFCGFPGSAGGEEKRGREEE